MIEVSENVLPKPKWLRVKAPSANSNFSSTRDIVKMHGLNTVCEEAACPNIGECWSKKHATFMILGSVCTRACKFCNVATGRPDQLDPHEPEKLAKALGQLNLDHVVITSVDRDDLDDGGAAHFLECITQIRKSAPNTTIEILTPDFLRKDGALEIIMKNPPDVFNHNIETVPSLYKTIRKGARYDNSLSLLRRTKEAKPDIFTKSGMMVGLGEEKDEILSVMDDLRENKVDFLTIGQYLRPTKKHADLKKYYTPDEFNDLKKEAEDRGFLMVSSSPLTRSSYHAGDDFKILKKNRVEKLKSAI